jgi:parallel beta-helix repeat protein
MRRTIVLLATMVLTVLVASGVALAVTKIGSAGAQSSVVGPGESIQKAVNAADPGDTIVVRGVHREDVVIRKNGIKLRGEDAVIEAPPRAKADSPCSKVFGPEAICVFGDANLRTGKVNRPIKDVSISGFTIRGFKQKPNKGFGTIMIDVLGARNATVEGNHVVGSAGAGIGISPEGLNNTIENNDLTDNKEDGVFVQGQRNATVANNTLKGNAVGIFAEDSTESKILSNDITDSTFLGIAVFDSPATKILSNDVSRSEFDGIFLGGQKSANAKVVGNNISSSAFGIYVADTHRGSIAGNTSHDNCAGIFFEAYEDNGLRLVGDFEVRGNTVENNTRSCRAAQFERNFSGIGIALLGARDMEVTGNRLSGNVPSGPTPVSGGVVVSTDPFFGETIKPRNNSVIGNHFGRNKPDIFWDETGSANSFVGNLCDTSVPSTLCN